MNYKTMVEKSPDVIARFDSEHRHLYINPVVEEYIGVPHGEVIGKTNRELNLPESVIAKWHNALEKTFKSGKKQRLELKFPGKKGTVCFMNTIVPELDNKGNVKTVISYSRDITIRKNAEFSLQKAYEKIKQKTKRKDRDIEHTLSLLRQNQEKHDETVQSLNLIEDRYRDLYENAPDMYFSIELASGKIIECNQTFLNVLGYEKDEVLGRTVIDFYRESNQNKALRALQRLKRYGEVKNTELVIKKKNGRSIYVVLKESVVYDKQTGKPAYSRSSWRDVSDRKKAEIRVSKQNKELERSNEDLERFAHIASHDLQEPLRVITSYIQLLSAKYSKDLDEKAQKYMDQIVDGSKRMKKLINDLLVYSKINGMEKRSASRVNLNKLMSEVLDGLEFKLSETKAIIKIDKLPVIYGNPTLIGQVFSNIITNSLKFRKQDEVPEILVNAEKIDDGWLFKVKDNGIGIEEEYFDKIFEVFQKLHTRQEYGGTGVGLSICRKIVNQLGGKIWLESEYGTGTTFYFTIPGNR